MNRLLSPIFVAACSFLTPLLSAQTAGTLDPIFGDGGLVISAPVSPTSMDNAQCAGVRPTGEVVFAGVSGGASSFNMTVGQLLPDGSLDTSFGNGGVATFASEGGSNFAYDLEVLADGKVLVCGAVSLTAANTAFAVWRLMPDGTLDATFAAGGVLIVDLDTSEDYARNLWVDASGQITAAGASKQPESSLYRSALIRCDADGTLLNDFGNGGIQISPLVTSENHDIRGGTVAPDGSIYLVGYTTIEWETQAIVVHFTAAGEFDADFGENGMATGELGSRYFDVHVSGDRVLAVGDGSSGASGIVQAFDLAGASDAGFGTDGLAAFNVGGANVLLAIAEQADGKLVVGGSASTGFLMRDFMVARLGSNGALDAEWGDAGVTVTVVGPGFEDVNDLVIQPDGKIIAAGFAQITNNDFVFARYLAGEMGAISGCTDANACNFNPAATEDDGTCYGPGDPCDDGDDSTANDTINADCDCVGEPVSVPEALAPQFRAFPNPVQGELNIQFAGNADRWEVTLQGLNGQLIKREQVSGSGCVWDLNGLPAGAYLLTVESKGVRQRQQLLIH